MKVNKLTLFIVDDNIPKISKYVEQSFYDKKLDAALLLHLVDSAQWTGQHNLEELTSSILKSEQSVSGELEVCGFTHPSLCLDAIDEGVIPNIVIYDWEYTSESQSNSSKWLKEILDSTKAFVFVYSKVRNDIPPFLNKSDFDSYSHRFQLFLKGDDSSSVFSSEEFIHQYIVSKIRKSNIIKIQGVEISFQENGYLENPSDILFLEKIFGKAALIQNLKSKDNTISDISIEDMIHDIDDKVLQDEKRNLLISSQASLLIEKYSPEKELSYLEVLKNFGLEKLIEVLEIGIVKI